MLDSRGLNKTPKKEYHADVTSQQAWVSFVHGNLCTRGWDFHLQEDRAALKVVLLLCVCSDPTLEMCTSQLRVCSRDFSRERAKPG